MASAALFILLAACQPTLFQLYDTPHPETAKVSVTTQWSERGKGVEIPTTWTLNIGDYTSRQSATTVQVQHLFAAGAYSLSAYNQPQGIGIKGTTATVAGDAKHANCIEGTPEWLFTHWQKVTLEKDKDYSLTAEMKQQVREFNLLIQPKGESQSRITSISGTLSGVATSMDFASNTYASPANVALSFVKINKGDNAGKWMASVRLLGIADTKQLLNCTITYADGNPKDQTLTSDLSNGMKEFNSHKTEPLTLGGTIVDAPGNAGIAASITDWVEISGTAGDAQ